MPEIPMEETSPDLHIEVFINGPIDMHGNYRGTIYYNGLYAGSIYAEPEAWAALDRVLKAAKESDDQS